MKYRSDIDGLRAIAVVPVVIYHAGLGLQGGFVGVDVFFVISGFLITYLLISEIEKGEFSISRFYERRARRLFPALFAMLLATTIAAAVIMLPYDFEDFGKSLVATTLFATNIWFYREEGYFTEAAELEPLLHAWSLGIEEQFYIIFPLLLFVAARFLGTSGSFFLILVLGLGSFVASMEMLSVAPESAFYLPHLRAWELLIGSLLALAFWRGWWTSSWLPAGLAHVASVVGLALIIGPVFAYNAETVFPGLAALFPCLGAMVLIAANDDGRSIGARLLSLRPMVFTGKISYSLYLWHWPIISLSYYQFGELSASVGLVCLAVSILLAYVSWRFVEQPVRNRRRVSNPAIASGSVTAMSVLVGVGVTIWQLDGIPERMDERLLAMADSSNFLHDRRDCHFVTPERTLDNDLCVRGAASVNPSFALVGDSHADAFSPAIFTAAAELGVSGYQYTAPGFAPLPGVRRLGRNERDDVDALILFLEQRPSIRTLIITAYWQRLLTGYSYRHAGEILIDNDYDGSGAEYNVTAVGQGLARLAARFPDRQIILLDDVPTGGALHVRDQLRRLRYVDLAQMGLARSEYQAQRATYVPVLATVAEEQSNLHFTPIFDGVCDEQLCPLFDAETLLFRDGDHLSWEGALRLAPDALGILQSMGSLAN